MIFHSKNSFFLREGKIVLKIWHLKLAEKTGHKKDNKHENEH